METKGKILRQNSISVNGSSVSNTYKGITLKGSNTANTTLIQKANVKIHKESEAFDRAKNKGPQISVQIQGTSQTGREKAPQNVKKLNPEETSKTAKRKIERQSSVVVYSNSISKGSVLKGVSTKPIKRAVRNVQNELNKTNDSGLQAVSQGVVLTKTGIKAFQAAQKATPTVIRTAKGVYNVAGKTIRVVKRVDSTIAMLKTGAIVLNGETAARLLNYAKDRIIKSKPVVKMVNAVLRMKSEAQNAWDVWKYALNTARYRKRIIIPVKGVVSGIVKVHISKVDREQLKNAAIRGIKIGLRKGAKGAVFTAKGVFKGSIHIGKGLNSGLRSAGSALMNTNDNGIQAAGVALQGIHYTVKGIAYTPKVAKTTYKGVKGVVKGTIHTGSTIIKGSIRTYKGVKTGLKIYKRLGVSKATKMYARRWSRSFAAKVRKGLAKAGHSVVTAAVDGLKFLGKKLIIPLAIVLIVIFFGSSLMGSVVGAVVSIFSPFISDDGGNEIDETEFLTQEITSKRDDLVKEIKETYNDNLMSNGGNYHYIRFFNAFNDTEIDFTDSNISTSIYAVKDYVEAIQSIFHTIIICEHDGEASKRQMKKLVTEMWNLLNGVQTEELPTEYCSMTVDVDGTIEADPDADGVVHADTSICPNHSVDALYHEDTDDGILASCDKWYYLCEGHKGSCTHQCNNDCAYYYGCRGLSITHLFHLESCKRYYCGHSHSAWNSASDPGCYSTTYCNSGNPMDTNCTNGSKHKSCEGYYECYGHKILALSININSFGDLLDKYFLDEIHTLEAKSSRTADEETRLSNLYEYYDVCLNYMAILEEEYGYGFGSEAVSLDGVTLTPLTNFACSFIGKPYVWGGSDPNTGADCSGFVKYVFANYGVTMNRTAHEQVLQGSLVDGLDNAQPGDLIFWSENGTDTGVYHVAIYLGNNKIIHASNSRPYPTGGIKVSNIYGTIFKIKRML